MVLVLTHTKHWHLFWVHFWVKLKKVRILSKLLLSKTNGACSNNPHKPLAPFSQASIRAFRASYFSDTLIMDRHNLFLASGLAYASNSIKFSLLLTLSRNIWWGKIRITHSNVFLLRHFIDRSPEPFAGSDASNAFITLQLFTSWVEFIVAIYVLLQ